LYILRDMKGTKIGLVGIGKMGGYHAKTVINHPDCILHGIYDIDIPKAQAYVDAHPPVPESNSFSDAMRLVTLTSDKKPTNQIKVYQSLEEMIKDVDAVIIATPASTHFEVLSEVMSLGSIPILCEKPIVHTEKLFDELVSKIDPLSYPPIEIGHCERHGAVLASMKADGILNIDIDDITFTRFNTSNRNVDVSLVWDTMIHDIDLLFHLFPDANVTDVKLTINIDDEKCTRICCKVRLDSAPHWAIFDCGKGMDAVDREITIKGFGAWSRYDFVHEVVEESDAKGYFKFISKNPKDNLTIQLDNFIKSINLQDGSHNANIWRIKKAIQLASKIDYLHSFKKAVTCE